MLSEILSLVALTCGVSSYVAPSRPNILFIVADDLGYNDISYNNDQVISPNLDALARDGVILTHNYVMSSCTPSRHALLTGRYPYKSRMQHMVLADEEPNCSPTDLKFLPERLKSLGYNTFLVGKWHLGFCQKACTPLERGFDHFYGMYTGAEGFYDHMSAAGYDWRNDCEVDRSVDGKYHTTIVNDYVVDLFDNYNSPDPFFMLLSYANVHTPIEVPSKYTDMYPDVAGQRRTYLGMMTIMDESIGDIMAKLKERGLYDNTIVVFTSDNGGEHGGNADNSPLRGGKASLYEGGHRVVGFVNSPLLEKSGYQHNGLFHIVDWTKTLMSIVGGKVEEGVDGYDLSDMIMSGKSSNRQEIIYNIDMEPMPIFGQSAVRVGDYKLIWGPPGFSDGRGQNLTLVFENDKNLALLGKGPYVRRLHPEGKRVNVTNSDIAVMSQLFQMWSWSIDDVSKGYVQLFNLADDPNEYVDLSTDPAYAEVITALKQYLVDLLAEYRKPAANAGTRRADSNPSNYNGAWTEGWCEDLDLGMTSP